MPKYKIVSRTLTFNKPGLSPTVKNGTDKGWVSSGEFTPLREINGWLEMEINRWVGLLNFIPIWFHYTIILP